MVCRNARGRIPAAPDPKQTPLQTPVPGNPKKKHPHCSCKALHHLGQDLWTDSSSQTQHQPFLASRDAGVIQNTALHTATGGTASVVPLPEVQHSNTSREAQRERAFSRYILLSWAVHAFCFQHEYTNTREATCCPLMLPVLQGCPP